MCLHTPQRSGYWKLSLHEIRFLPHLRFMLDLGAARWHGKDSKTKWGHLIYSLSCLKKEIHVESNLFRRLPNTKLIFLPFCRPRTVDLFDVFSVFEEFSLSLSNERLYVLQLILVTSIFYLSIHMSFVIKTLYKNRNITCLCLSNKCPECVRHN